MSTESGNKQKLESFFKEESNALKSYIGSRIKASANKDPEDILQDVAYNLFAGADGYGPISNVASFVYRSIKNKVIDSMRKGRPPESSGKENEVEKWAQSAELMYGETANRYSTEMLNALKESMGELNAPDFAIIMAIDIEGYTFREISEETGTPEGTLMSRRHRALSKLNKSLKNKNNTL